MSAIAESSGNTLLIMAAFGGSDQIVQKLLETGADVASCNIKSFQAHMVAAENGHTECLRLLLEAGADVTSSNLDGFQAHMAAAENGHLECLHVLLEAGADLASANYAGENALMLAVRNSHAATIEMLIESGAGANLTEIRDESGNTAMSLAEEKMLQTRVVSRAPRARLGHRGPQVHVEHRARTA